MTEQETSTTLKLKGHRVLVAEDEALIAYELVEELERLGAQPIGPVSTVADALALIEREALTAALINVFLRGEATSPIADALIGRDIPFVFVTGNDDFVRENYPDVPSHPKPSNMPILVGALKGLLTVSP